MGVWPETDWPKIIETHRQALKTVLDGLVALATCLGGGPTVPRHLQRAVFRLLRPAESAARRLIILAALRLSLPPLPPLRPIPPKPAPPPATAGIVVRVNLGLAVGPPPPKRQRPAPSDDAAPRPPAFRLLDPMRRIQLRRYPVRTSVPRILFPGYAEPFRIVRPRQDDALDATSLTRRLAALAGALGDIPAQATRYLRWKAHNARASAAGYRRRLGALRGGRPPGQTARKTHDIHDMLERLHDMATYALDYPDTS